MLPRAVAAWASANQTAVICGPALGGLIYAVSPVLVGVICLVCSSPAITLVSLRPRRTPAAARASRRRSPRCLPAFDYIRSRRGCSA